MSTQAKCGLVGVVLMMLIVAVVWDRTATPAVERIGRWTVGSITADGEDQWNQPWAEALEETLNRSFNTAPGTVNLERCRITIRAWSYIEPDGAYCAVAVLRFPDGRMVAGFYPCDIRSMEPDASQELKYADLDPSVTADRYRRQKVTDAAVYNVAYRATKRDWAPAEPMLLEYRRSSFRVKVEELWPVLAAGYGINSK